MIHGAKIQNYQNRMIVMKKKIKETRKKIYLSQFLQYKDYKIQKKIHI